MPAPRHRRKIIIRFSRLFLAVVLLLGLNRFAFPPGVPGSKALAAGSGQEVIDLVNQLRAANGLALYRPDSALMAAAQGHSETMA